MGAPFPPALLVAAATIAASGSAASFELEAAHGVEIRVFDETVVARAVSLRRGDLWLCCDRAELRMRKGRLVHLECAGRATLSGPAGPLGQADRASMGAGAGRLILEGEAEVFVAGGYLKAERVVYDVGGQVLTTSGGRARFARGTRGPSPTRARPCPPASEGRR